MKGAGMLVLVAAAVACSGDGRVPRDLENAGTARGAPPAGQDTPAIPADSNPSTATDTLATPDSTPAVQVHEVNVGTRGMISRVRWTLPADQRSILVVEDPVGVEAEAVPDAFLYASENTNTVFQVQGVWDVAPSPDWKQLAWGLAFVFRSGEADSIPAREWQRLYAWLPEDVAERSTALLRRRLEPYTFPVSGMSYAKAIALTQVMKVDSLPAGKLAVVEAPTVRVEGWRVRWTPSGDRLAVGAAPRTVQDDAEATRWTLVRPRLPGGYHDSVGVATAATRLASVTWIPGPTFDVSIPFDMNKRRHVPALGATVTSENGTIRVERQGRTTEVGPGAALATTRDGRFIVAIVPAPAAKEYEPKIRVVVYELAP